MSQSQKQADHHVLLLACFMLLFGTVNTIANKYQDLSQVGREADGTPIYFDHPGVQSACMFLGELLCLFMYCLEQMFQKKTTNANTALVSLQDKDQEGKAIIKVLAFLIPALCDTVGTTLLYVGLFYTYASSFQMLRGCVVLFSGVLTIFILKRKLHSHHWSGMFLISLGAAIVGFADCLKDNSSKQPPAVSPTPPHVSISTDVASSPFLLSSNKNNAASDPLFGNVLVILAQIAAAFQFIIEEKFLSKYQVPPMRAVGLEGMWGLLICSIALPVVGYLKEDSLFGDISTAAKEILASQQLLISTVSSIISIAFFNFFGLSVTRHLSGAARATIDACRTLFIWLFALQVGWEQFHGLEVMGFFAMVIGTCIYNKIISLSSVIVMNQTATTNTTSGDERTPLLQTQGQTESRHKALPIKGANQNFRYMVRSLRMGYSYFSTSNSDSFVEPSSSPASPRVPEQSSLTRFGNAASSLNGAYASSICDSVSSSMVEETIQLDD